VVFLGLAGVELKFAKKSAFGWLEGPLITDIMPSVGGTRIGERETAVQGAVATLENFSPFWVSTL
jgi:hypothetical protein